MESLVLIIKHYSEKNNIIDLNNVEVKGELKKSIKILDQQGINQQQIIDDFVDFINSKNYPTK